MKFPRSRMLMARRITTKVIKMHVVSVKKPTLRRVNLLLLLRIYVKQCRLNFLRSEVRFKWAEIDRTRQRIVNLDNEIIRTSSDLSSLKLKK